MVALRTDTGTTYRALRSTGKGFVATNLYHSTLAFDHIKLASGDVDRNGRGDLVVYAKVPGSDTGTRLYVHRSTGTDITAGALWLDDGSLDWQTAEPY